MTYRNQGGQRKSGGDSSWSDSESSILVFQISSSRYKKLYKPFPSAYTHTQSRSGIHFMRHSCSVEKMLGSGHMIVVLTEHGFISLVTAQRSSKCVNQRLGLADTFVHL